MITNLQKTEIEKEGIEALVDQEIIVEVDLVVDLEIENIIPLIAKL